MKQTAFKFVKRAQRGFTLIELMVVMFVIALLLSIAAPVYQKVHHSFEGIGAPRKLICHSQHDR